MTELGKFHIYQAVQCDYVITYMLRIFVSQVFHHRNWTIQKQGRGCNLHNLVVVGCPCTEAQWCGLLWTDWKLRKKLWQAKSSRKGSNMVYNKMVNLHFNIFTWRLWIETGLFNYPLLRKHTSSPKASLWMTASLVWVFCCFSFEKQAKQKGEPLWN